MKICFYARLKADWYFELLDFYSNDIKILEELGYEVVKVRNSALLPLDCDIYFVWWWSSGFIPLIKAKLRGKPVITIGNIHYDDPSPQGYHQRPFYIKFFINYSLKKSDVQIATANREYEAIVNLGASNPKLVYHAIDENKYSYTPFEGRENFLFTLTQLTKPNVKRKKVKEIILAFNELLKIDSTLKLYVAGNTTDDGYPELLALVKELALEGKVKFLGRISDGEKINYYQRCKVYVQPTSYEGFGMAIAESMMCGAPVVTSATGAVTEVTGELAVFVNPDDVSDIAAGIRKLLYNSDLCNKLSREGSMRIKNLFSYERRKIKIKEIINEVRDKYNLKDS
ncbi:MAG: glycosyltransferase family 4 protein [Ignavibacteria bacterium]